jgi:hypothetical protein
MAAMTIKSTMLIIYINIKKVKSYVSKQVTGDRKKTNLSRLPRL